MRPRAQGARDAMLRLSVLWSMFGLSWLIAAAPVAAQEEDEAAPPTHTIEPEPFKVEVSLSGTFEAEQMSEVILRPEVWSSFVVEKAVPQGAQVKQGDPILWFETEKIDDAITSAEFALELGALNLQQAELELAGLEASVPLDLKEAERRKQAAEDDYAYFVEIGAKRSREAIENSLKASEYSLEYALEELNQLEQMYKEDDLTEETEEIILKRARRDAEQTEFFTEGARLRYERQIKEELPREEERQKDALERATIAYARAKETLPRSLEEKRIELEKLRHARQEAEENFEQLQADRELMVVEAPADGIVYYGHCDRGSWPVSATIAKQLRTGGSVSANQVVMTIVTPGPAFVRVNIPEAQLRHVQPGATGVVVPTAFPDVRLPAVVKDVESIPISDGTFDGRIEFEMDRGDVQLVPGMNCTVRITVVNKPDALTAPKTAVFTEELDDSQKYVYVAVEEGEPEKRSVAVGETSGEEVEILSGLEAGEKILLKKPE
ncbi:MAG: HlyD family efflux transporter periplasmic adaptor subunit [Planctomycetota bacterium]|nr:MAG: HlyD family efflux transporter periplasmic adaptor subunit [Planctomycetota bacterium]